MLWYTIIAEPPFSEQLKHAKLNSAGQLVAWDGHAERQNVLVAAERLAEHTGKVSVFQGKDLGKLIETYVR